MTVTLRPALDGDRVWVDVDAQCVAFIRLDMLAALHESRTEWGPRELIPLVTRGRERRVPT